MIHYGDITKINGAEVPMVDIITGGSPCQDLSVAGKRAGLDGERSGLFMEQIRIIKEMRNESIRKLSMRGTAYTWADIRPRYMVWENVPGAFSSNKGQDFKAVLEETAKIVEPNAVIPEPEGGKWPYAGCIVGDGWSIAWRLHDAQFWGVPQRRKRICLLADFASDNAGRILFELQRKANENDREETVMDIGEESESKIQSVSESVPGNTEESGKEGEEAAGDIGASVEEASKCLNGWDVQSKHIQPENGIAESIYAGECRGGGGESYVLQNAMSFQEIAGKPGGGKGLLIQDERTGALATHPQNVLALNGDVAGTLDASYYKGCGERAGVERDVVCYGISSYDSNAMKSDNPNSGIYEAETSRTLDLNCGSPACNQGGMAVVCATTEMTPKTDENGVSFSLRSRDYKDPQIVCLEGNGSRESHKGDGYRETDTMYTLNTIEQHAVAYRKQAHPQNAEQGQGWESTDVNDTLNVYDNSEIRTPTLVVDQGAGKSQCSVQEELSQTLATTHDGAPVILENHPNDSRIKISEDGNVQTLSSRMGTGGGNVPLVMYPETTGSLMASGYDKLGTQEAANGMYVVEQSSWDGGQVSPTLTANNANGGQRMPDKDNFNAVISYSVDAYNQTQAEEVTQPIRAKNADTDHIPCTYGLDRAAYNQGINAQYDFAVEEEKIGTQVAKGPGAVCQSVVRRLTPMECERLQGFPDGWTDIGDWVDSKGKTHKGDADSPRYKALGNSIALPFWMWLAKRIRKQYIDSVPTMASLFDGIGGFPFSFRRYGCVPVWASEIEEFPIAVTKIHFPD